MGLESDLRPQYDMSPDEGHLVGGGGKTSNNPDSHEASRLSKVLEPIRTIAAFGIVGIVGFIGEMVEQIGINNGKSPKSPYKGPSPTKRA